MEVSLQSKTTFNGKRHFMKDDLDWKMTSFEEILRLRSAIYRRCGHFLHVIITFIGFKITFRARLPLLKKWPQRRYMAERHLEIFSRICPAPCMLRPCTVVSAWKCRLFYFFAHGQCRVYLSCGVPFPFWTPDNISGLISVVLLLLRWEFIKTFQVIFP